MLELFEAGSFAASFAAAEALCRQEPDPSALLVAAACLAGLGDDDAALSLFERVETALSKAAEEARPSDDDRRAMTAAVEAVRACLRGGSRSFGERKQLANHALLRTARLPKGEG